MTKSWKQYENKQIVSFETKFSMSCEYRILKTDSSSDGYTSSNRKIAMLNNRTGLKTAYGWDKIQGVHEWLVPFLKKNIKNIKLKVILILMHYTSG